MPLFNSDFNARTFWAELFRDTDDLSKAALYSELLDLDHDWESMFKDWFRTYAREEDFRQQAMVRAYVGGAGDSRPVDRIIRHPPTDTDNLSEWGERLFGQNEWCIVLDRMSGSMEDLAVEVAKAAWPAVAAFQPGEFSLEISPYIGRYRYTPFGAHLDVGGLSVLHLHLGPGDKKMTLWPKDYFRKLTDSSERVHKTYEHLISKGKTYTIRSGDVFHLPACEQYHVATNTEYSVGITLGLKMENQVSLFRKAIRDFQEESPGVETRDAIDLYRHKKLSNSGFLMKPALKNHPESEVAGRMFYRKDPFKIVTRQDGESQYSVFARGRKLPIVVRERDSLELIGKLNGGGKFCVKQKYDSFDEQFRLIHLLYNYRAVVALN